MPMSESSLADRIANQYDDVKNMDDRDDNTYLRLLEVSIDNEFQRAVPTMTNVDITTPANTLKINLVSVYEMAREIATACCTYWSTAIETSGVPAVGKEIVSVTNDAMTHIEPLTNDILAIYDGHNSNPPYMEFSEVLLTHMRNIEWTVTETDYVTVYTLSVKIT